MTPEHSAKLRGLPSDQRDRVLERACVIHEAEGGRLSWAEADELAWSLEIEAQPSLPGVRR